MKHSSSSRQVLSFKNQHFHSCRPTKEQVTPHINANLNLTHHINNITPKLHRSTALEYPPIPAVKRTSGAR